MPHRSPLDAVNPLQGTASHRRFSTGNTYPAVGVPRGMTYWTPQTSDGVFIFDRREPNLTGLRATHSPSPWMGDFGHFDLLPTVGPPGLTPSQRATAFCLADADVAPHRAALRLPRHQLEVRVAASARAAVVELTYPADAGDQAGVVLQVGASTSPLASSVRVHDGGRRVTGVSRACHGDPPPGFGGYFVLTIDGPGVADFGTFTPRDLAPGHAIVDDPRAGVHLRFASAGPVTLRLGTSFISEDQARRNLDREVGGRSLDDVARTAADAWQRWLALAPDPDQLGAEPRRYASAMYRVGLFPTAMHEPDAQGHLHHYSPYDGRVHPGKAYTNNGFWDTHRTVYPLLAGLDPQGFGEIVDGLLAAYREGGWLPKWTSPGYRDCMVGTHVDAVIAEAFAHDIPGFDRHEAYAAIRQHAFTPGDPGGRWGRVGLEPYEQLGYVDDRIPHSVCRTLDFAYCDWCIAQVAARLGHDDDARTLTRRSRRYRHLWDPGVGFMRPRRADGTWAEPWDEFAWAPAYIEGGPWQHSWAVPHDLDGLAGLIGGRDALADKLERLFETPPRFGVGGYPEEIHEMTEMALARDRDGRSFGQYAHSNQPSHAVLWQLHELGRHAFADAQITRVCRDLYTPDDLPGDEDNGQMSAWYLLTTLGRRRPCPGRPLGTR